VLPVYCLPNDELEQDRLDLSHLLMTKAIGDKLFLAPIDMDKTQRVLDIGTGTGICTHKLGTPISIPQSPCLQ
jgi:ubiquinone/menaquinone biosynthesis C-methylase UbiE